MKKRLWSGLLAGALIVSLSMGGCGKGAEKKRYPEGEAGHYTFRCISQDPGCWNPLKNPDEAGQQVLSCTTTPLYEVETDENGVSKINGLLAEGMPVDVTSQYAGKDPYGVPADKKKGYAWQVTLKKGETWENGDKITGDTLADTLKNLLDPDKKYEQAEMFINGAVSLANGKDYYGKGYRAATDGKKQVPGVKGKKLFYNPDRLLAVLGGRSLGEYYRYYQPDDPKRFCDPLGNDLFVQIQKQCKDAYTEVGSELQKLLNNLAKNLGHSEKNAYMLFCMYQDETSADWKNIGVEADGQKLTLILNRSVTSEQVALALKDLTLINQKVYRKAKQKYGSSVDTYQSYGPYKIVSYDKDKGMTLKKNNSWFGYKDKDLKSGYQTTDIDIRYSDVKKAVAAFKEGWYDQVTGTEGELKDLGSGSKTGKIDSEDSTFYLARGDFYDLEQDVPEGVSKKLLAYKDFRHGLAMLFNKNTYAETYGGGGIPQYGVFNDAYLLSLQGDSYRSTSTGKNVLKKVYGVKKTETLTQKGIQNIKSAGKLMKSAYDICLEDGNILDTDKVVLTFSAEDETDIKEECKYLQQSISAAVLGSPLESRISVQPAEKDQTGDIQKKRIRGNVYDPCALFGKFYDPECSVLSGSYPSLETLSMTLGGKKKTETLGGWFFKAMYGTYKKDSYRLTILSQLEQRLLESYLVIPLCRNTRSCVYSRRIGESANKSGGVDLRKLTYTMDDKEWADTFR